MNWHPITTPQEHTLGVSARYTRSLDPDTCVRQGGHCWVRDSAVTASIPPIYTEYCKHCPAYRRGRPQESTRWDDPQVST